MFARLSIPTPFAVGPVNAYLAGRTVVDPGPGSEEAWTALLAGLEERALTPADVAQVLVTHPHPDHFGLAARLHEEGADVCASPPCADIVADFAGRLDEEQEFFTDFFERHGMAATTAESVTELAESFLSFAPAVETDTLLDDGDTVTVDGVAVTAEAVAGHAPGERIYTYEAGDGDEQRALVGDHVLGDITPNPLLQPPEGGERPRVLPAYNRSLERLRDREFDRLLPGHREAIRDPVGRIDEILDAHENRTANVHEIVDGPTTAVEVMNELFDDLPLTEYFPGMSEAIGHLDVLEERGAVTRSTNGGLVVYERTD
jgi:glyoxylase-like metal-dependent hydrolase (beta-lactamase superfamily II)